MGGAVEGSHFAYREVVRAEIVLLASQGHGNDPPRRATPGCQQVASALTPNRQRRVNKKPRRGARRIAMRPLRMFVRLARRKNTSVDNQKRLWILTFFAARIKWLPRADPIKKSTRLTREPVHGIAPVVLALPS